MKCVSCEVEINPKWRHAIEINICPFCGQAIMEELLKSLFSSLQETMEKLQAYPDQLNDWLLSNYSYIKTDDITLKNYVSKDDLKEMKRELDGEEFERKRSIIKVKTERGEEEVVTEKIQSDSKTAEFFARAELIKTPARDGDMDTGDGDDVEVQPIKAAKPKTFKSAAERTEYLKKLKKKIESEGSPAIIDENGLAAMIQPSSLETADPSEVVAYQSMIGGSDIINSALPNSGLDDEDTMTNRVLSANLAAAARKDPKAQSGGYNAKDAQALQNLVDKSKGTNMGGGFSRRD